MPNRHEILICKWRLLFSPLFVSLPGCSSVATHSIINLERLKKSISDCCGGGWHAVDGGGGDGNFDGDTLRPLKGSLWWLPHRTSSLYGSAKRDKCGGLANSGAHIDVQENEVSPERHL